MPPSARDHVVVIQPEPRHVIAGHGMVSPRLVAKADEPAIDRSQPESTVLAALGEERGPLRRGGLEQFSGGQVGDVHSDQGLRVIAETGFDSARSGDVCAVIVCDQHELRRYTPEGGILISQPRADDFEGGDMDLPW